MKEIDVNNVKIDANGLSPTLLTVLFIGLKLTGHISWSWWWVLLPLWISFAAWFIIGLIVSVAKGK